ncbi:hypothetical protein ABZX77_16205 [Streptomyces sp. NPDC004237]|uniref:hypothetical protein n=1 Tax=Streptomyces sp. NPDC004237 TaxID=3154455 RepID=UPI0033A11E99
MARLQLPDETRKQLLLRIYQQAEELRWDFLTNPQRTEYYRQWYSDPRIGVVLTSFVGDKAAMDWIKDVAMKEYGRAKEGIGQYVPYVARRFRGTDEIALAACGAGWSPVLGTLDIKPNNTLVSDGLETRYVCWGRPAQFRDLVWAALNQAVDRESRPAIVVTTQDGETISGPDKARQRDIAAHCGIDLAHLHRTMIVNPDYIG